MATLTVSNSTSIARKVKMGSTKVLEAEIDFALTANVMAQNDVAEVIAIPANSLVHAIFWEVTRVEGAARNFAIGDGSDTDGFITTTSANSLADGASAFAATLGGTGAAADPVVVTGYSGGKFYTAADTIDVLAVTSGGLTTGKLKVKALVTTFDV